MIQTQDVTSILVDDQQEPPTRNELITDCIAESVLEAAGDERITGYLILVTTEKHVSGLHLLASPNADVIQQLALLRSAESSLVDSLELDDIGIHGDVLDEELGIVEEEEADSEPPGSF